MGGGPATPAFDWLDADSNPTNRILVAVSVTGQRWSDVLYIDLQCCLSLQIVFSSLSG